MKTIFTLPFFLILCGPAWSQETTTDKQLAEVAHKVVTTSAKIKSGEVVVISGGKHTLALLEALSMEAAKAGGRVAPILLTSDRILRSLNTEVPEQHLGQPSPLIDWLKTVDVWMSTPDVEDPQAVLGGVPDTHLAKTGKSAALFRNALNQSKIRAVEISVPTRTNAELVQVDFAKYEKMQWEAINADYQQIAEKGNQLKSILARAKTVKVTSSSGTNFTFSVGNRPIFVNAGIVKEAAPRGPFLSRTASLPGGTVIFAPVETSASGKVVAPRDVCRPYERLRGATYEFKDGKMISFRAEANAKCFEEYFAAYTGAKDMFSSFQIGLNPGLKVAEDGGDYRPGEAAGMVFIGIGNNDLLGGNNKTNFGWFIPLVNATVEVDGKTVVKDGQLVF